MPPDTFCAFLAREKNATSPSVPTTRSCSRSCSTRPASLTVNENADPDVRSDLSAALDRIAPEAWNRPNASGVVFAHVDEGDDDMPAHVKATLCGPGLVLPLARIPSARGLRRGRGDVAGPVPVRAQKRRRGAARGVRRRGRDARRARDGALPARGRGCHEVTAEIEAAVRSLWGGDDGGDDEDDADASRADATAHPSDGRTFS